MPRHESPERQRSQHPRTLRGDVLCRISKGFFRYQDDDEIDIIKVILVAKVT